MTSQFNANVIWIVMKRENFENFESDIHSPGIWRMPDKAFKHLDDALEYIKSQEPFVLPCWELIGEELDHVYDCSIERGLTYEVTRNDKTYFKDIWYDIIPEELI